MEKKPASKATQQAKGDENPLEPSEMPPPYVDPVTIPQRRSSKVEAFESHPGPMGRPVGLIAEANASGDTSRQQDKTGHAVIRGLVIRRKDTSSEIQTDKVKVDDAGSKKDAWKDELGIWNEFEVASPPEGDCGT